MGKWEYELAHGMTRICSCKNKATVLSSPSTSFQYDLLYMGKLGYVAGDMFQCMKKTGRGANEGS